jgi:hypothetical protein
MNRSFDVQLQVALRALEEVVAPALDGTEKHVAEQLHLAIATLHFVKTRLPEARRYYRMELRSYMRLAEDAAALASRSLPERTAVLLNAIAAGQQALDDPEADLDAYQAATSNLRDLITGLSDASVGTPHAAELDKLILDRSGAILSQCRQWCTPFGFELKPEELAPPGWGN